MLRDVYARGKYRDAILPMTVIRRLDVLLEPTKEAVLSMKEQLEKAGVANPDLALCKAAEQPFYNNSPFTLRDLKARAKQQQLKADFKTYLDGFSANVQEILDKFKFRNQIPTLVEADILGSLIEKFLDPSINLSPKPVHDSDGNIKLPPLDNHGMGTVFEELIRRWIIENDWLEAIIALPLNMFYNTGIATYIWVLTNRKPDHRKGKIQLINATEWFSPLRKNLGKKNCELTAEHIQRICDTFLAFEETEQSKIFPNEAFGYWKVTVERPFRLRTDLLDDARTLFRRACNELKEEPLAKVVDRVAEALGPGPHIHFNAFLAAVEADADAHSVNLTAKRKKVLQTELAIKDENAQPVIKKAHKPGRVAADPIHGLWEVESDGKPRVVEYEPDAELRDTEQVPLMEDGGIEAFFRREVLPHVSDAWIDSTATKIGYEISFTRYFYKPQPLRSLEEIKKDIFALEKEIALLNEQKQAIVNRAVTQGIGHQANLKPSGIDFLGDIPEHWIVKPLKRWVRMNARTLPEMTPSNTQIEYIDIGSVGTGFLVEKPERIQIGDAPSRARRILQKNDTIISTVRTYLKAVYFVDSDRENLIGSTGFAVLTPNSDIEPRFLGYVIQSNPFVEQVTANSVGMSYPAIAPSRLAALHLAMPPSRDEQQAILKEIAEQTRAIDKAIEPAQREVDLIREYQTSLLAQVVTGKVDVRHLALVSGDELPEAEPEDLSEGIDEEMPGAGELKLVEESVYD